MACKKHPAGIHFFDGLEELDTARGILSIPFERRRPGQRQPGAPAYASLVVAQYRDPSRSQVMRYLLVSVDLAEDKRIVPVTICRP